MPDNTEYSQSIKGTIDFSEIEDFDHSLPLRVALVRKCRVIRSAPLKIARNGTKASFELSLPRETEKIVSASIIVTPDVPDDRALAVDHHSVRVAASEFKDRVAKVAITIPQRIYLCWLRCCRNYKLRGRVVCRRFKYDPIEQQFVLCETPVRGAKVTAFDVDRFLWFCRKDTVGSDFTDIDGNFEINFRWCCWWWGPWFQGDWRLDPPVVGRIRDLFKGRPLPDPDPIPSFRVLEQLAEVTDVGDVVIDSIETADATNLDSLGKQIVARAPDAPDLERLRVWPWHPFNDCRPDIIFKVTQDCGDGVQVIFEEDCSDARPNIGTDLSGVTLVANSNACCAPCCDDTPDDDCLVIHGVGCGGYPLQHIEQDLSSDLVGYYTHGDHDRPFGRTIRLLGVFGEAKSIDFYKLQSRRRTTPGWTPWIDVPESQLGSFNRAHWTGFPLPLTKTQTVAPELVDGEIVYKSTNRFREENSDVNTTVPPSRADWLALWATASLTTDSTTGVVTETPLISDGLYELRIVGYEFDESSNSLINQQIMALCPEEDGDVDPSKHATLRLRMDNRNAISVPGSVHRNTSEPDCDYPAICAVVKNLGQRDEECVEPCGVLRVEAGDTITVRFNASDSDGHLAQYSLSAHWAESDVFDVLQSTVGTLSGNPDPLFGPSYAKTFLGSQATHRASLPVTDPERGRPFWHGGNFQVTVTVGDPVPLTTHRVFETCCAYLLRLDVWKRTTSGCGGPRHFHNNRCEFSFTLVRTDLPCGEDLCPPQNEA